MEDLQKRRERKRRWERSARGRATRKAYDRSDRGRARKQRYERSTEGQATRRRFQSVRWAREVERYSPRQEVLPDERSELERLIEEQRLDDVDEIRPARRDGRQGSSTITRATAGISLDEEVRSWARSNSSVPLHDLVGVDPSTGDLVQPSFLPRKKMQIRHGTVSGYVNDGCRCPDCTRANAEATRTYRARRRRGFEGEQR